MTLAAGQSLSFYEIMGPLGAGSMGEVYRARDTRLDREVAIKVLPEHVAADEERLRRFKREAKVLASLNHPNVAAIYSIDQEGDTSFIVMELVPGGDLSERLARGGLPLDETIDVCRQIAEGMEAAHEAGIVHRDLKPANVRLTPEGKVKVLDFGLARPLATPSQDDALSTEEGRVLGTPMYMAPEQARGKPVDKRVDVWAFGCVLFECLTGQRAFAGESLSDVLAAVLEREPDLSKLPDEVGSPLRDLLERCFRKDPRRRLRDIGDARILLEELAEGTLPLADPARKPGRGGGRLVLLLATTTIVAAGAAFWFWSTSSAPGPRMEAFNSLTNTPVRSGRPSWSPGGEFIAYDEMTSRGMDIFVKPVKGGTPELRVDSLGDDVSPRISPDGKYLAYASSSEPRCPVFLVATHGDRRTTRLVETGLPGLDMDGLINSLGDRPWFPDGRSLLVSIVDKNGRMAIHRVDVGTGEAEPLTFPGSGEEDFAGSLSFDGERIVFHRAKAGGDDLWTVPARGGEPTPLLIDKSLSLSPAWRPDGEHVVFRRSIRSGYFDLWEIDTSTRDLRQITFETRRVGSVSVAWDDRLAFTSSEHDTFLHAVSRSGDPELVLLNAHTGDNYGARPSPRNGKIAYHSTRTGNSEIWLNDRSGEFESQVTDSPATDLYADWSPDGERLVFVSDEEGPYKVFVLDIERGTRRLLVDKAISVHSSDSINANVQARWSPDADNPRIAFIASGDDGFTLWTVRPDGSDLKQALEDVYEFDWYRDSRRGLVTRQQDDGSTQLVAVNLETGESRVLYTGPHTEVEVAPDGTAVSFCSGRGHITMNLFVLELEPPTNGDGLPTAVGDPEQRTHGAGRWHTHNGGWTADSQTLVFTRDEDYGDIFELIERR